MNSRFVKKELIDMADIVDLLAEHICEFSGIILLGTT